MEIDSHTQNQRPAGLPKPAYIIYTHVCGSETKVAQYFLALTCMVHYYFLFNSLFLKPVIILQIDAISDGGSRPEYERKNKYLSLKTNNYAMLKSAALIYP